MYKFSFIVVFLSLPLIISAQTHKLKGKVEDSQHQSVPYATVGIQNKNDSTTRKSYATDTTGFFVFDGLKSGSYQLTVTAIGFKPTIRHLTLDADSNLGLITLSQDNALLKEVTVRAKNPAIIRKIDRTELNVENTVLSSANGWEIVKRAPGVQSVNGELSVRGSKQILVTINDKKLYLSGQELQAMLEGINGGDVKAVEVITNPPAKYEASGSAVINIKMKANTKMGYKGAIAASYQQGIYGRQNVNTNHNFKTGKVSLLGSYSFGKGIYYNEVTEVIQYPVQQQQWTNILRRKNNRDAEHNFRTRMDYQIDSLNTVSVGIDGFIARKNHALFTVPTSITALDNSTQRSFETVNIRRTPNTNTAGNLTYDHLFRNGDKIAFATDYTDYHNDVSQEVSTSNYVANTRFSRFLTINRQNIRLLSVMVDYSTQGKWFNLESGLKLSKVNANNDLNFQTISATALITDQELSNVFKYRETVMAGYLGLDKEIGNWSLKAGLRGEHTAVNGSSVNPEELNIQDYFNLFPTLYVQYKFNTNNQIGMSYGKRITRPQYSYLNPSKSYFTPNSYLVGDARLKPMLTDQISLLFNLLSDYGVTLYYMQNKNATIQLPIQDNTNNLLIQKITNIPRNQSYGLDINANLHPFSWWSVNINPGVAYLESSFSLNSSAVYYNHCWTVNGAVDNQFTLSKALGFTGGANFSFNTAGVQGPAKVSGVSSLGFTLRKKLYNDRAELTLMANDVYRGEKMRVTSGYSDQLNYFTYYGDTQNFRIGFKYNFGDIKIKGKDLKQRSDEQNRL